MCGATYVPNYRWCNRSRTFRAYRITNCDYVHSLSFRKRGTLRNLCAERLIRRPGVCIGAVGVVSNWRGGAWPGNSDALGNGLSYARGKKSKNKTNTNPNTSSQSKLNQCGGKNLFQFAEGSVQYLFQYFLRVFGYPFFRVLRLLPVLYTHYLNLCTYYVWDVSEINNIFCQWVFQFSVFE